MLQDKKHKSGKVDIEAPVVFDPVAWKSKKDFSLIKLEFSNTASQDHFELLKDGKGGRRGLGKYEHLYSVLTEADQPSSYGWKVITGISDESIARSIPLVTGCTLSLGHIGSEMDCGVVAFAGIIYYKASQLWCFVVYAPKLTVCYYFYIKSSNATNNGFFIYVFFRTILMSLSCC